LKSPPHRLGRPGAWQQVSSKGDCLTLVGILDRFPLRAKKRRDYAIWREAVMVLAQAPDWERMGELHEALRRGRVYSESAA
jgi:hypothetical protein